MRLLLEGKQVLDLTTADGHRLNQGDALDRPTPYAPPGGFTSRPPIRPVVFC